MKAIVNKDQLLEMLMDSKLLYSAAIADQNSQKIPCICHMETENYLGRGTERVAFQYFFRVNKFDDFELKAPGNKLVLKQFHEDYHKRKNIDIRILKNRYAHQAVQSTISKFLAKEFSNLESTKNKWKGTSITFLDAYIVRLASCKKMFYNAESLLPPNEFKRFTNNVSNIGLKCPEILIEFSLFTHKYTNGFIMVTDLQGYHDKDTNTYILTDPAIQCTSLDLFGRTNIGPRMITKCLKIYKKYVKDDFKVPFGLK